MSSNLNRVSLGVALLAVLAGSLVAQATTKVKAGKWTTKSQVPKGWVMYETNHYQIQSQVGRDKAKRLAKHMEKMLRVYKKLFPPGKDGFLRRPVKLFKDRQAFLDYGAPPGAAGYYTYGKREMVCYDTGKWMDQEGVEGGPVTGDRPKSRREIYDELLNRSKMDLLGVMAHEGWHQYFHWYVVSLVSLPSWINEGMGDYFYAARPIPGKRSRRNKVELGRMNSSRLGIIKAAARDKRTVPLEKFVRYTQSQYYANPGVCYAQGWAFCQFLLHHESSKLRKVIPKYIRLVRDDTNTETVTKKAFKGIDLAALDKEFLAWIPTLTAENQADLEELMDALRGDPEDEPAQPTSRPASRPSR